MIIGTVFFGLLCSLSIVALLDLFLGVLYWPLFSCVHVVLIHSFFCGYTLPFKKYSIVYNIRSSGK